MIDVFGIHHEWNAIAACPCPTTPLWHTTWRQITEPLWWCVSMVTAVWAALRDGKQARRLRRQRCADWARLMDGEVAS